MKWLPYFILAYLILGFQIGLRGFVEFKGAAPNLVLIVVIFLALNAPREPALLGCFLLGMMQDLLTLHPVGTWAVAYGLVAYFVLSTQEVVYPEHPLTHFSMTLAGGILCAVVLSLHAWLYAWFHGKNNGQSQAVGLFASALYSAILAPFILGMLQRMKGAFGFRRRV
jgi:rod shape-determining protein MreD